MCSYNVEQGDHLVAPACILTYNICIRLDPTSIVCVVIMLNRELDHLVAPACAVCYPEIYCLENKNDSNLAFVRLHLA